MISDSDTLVVVSLAGTVVRLRKSPDVTRNTEPLTVPSLLTTVTE